MKIQTNQTTLPAVKIGTSRQVVIPKKVHDALGLSSGDYLSVEINHSKGQVVFTPKKLVDKPLDANLAEALEDFEQGRVYGPFSNAKDLIASLDREARKKK